MEAKELQELERLANQATPGPWRYIPSSPDLPAEVKTDYSSILIEYTFSDGSAAAGFLLEEDAQFIAASREAIPDLIAEIRALKAELANAATHAEVQQQQAKNQEGRRAAGILLE